MDLISHTRPQPVIANMRLARRSLLLGAGAAAATALLPARLLARQATPAAAPGHAGHDALAIPELELIRTADGIAFPERVTAGLNRVTMINDAEGDFHAFTMRIPDDVSDEELAITTQAETLPDWWESTLFTGNPDQAPPSGGSVAGVVNYLPGRYLIMSVFEGTMAFFEVTGDAWGQPAPTADLELGLVEFGFLGLDEPLAAGPQTWRITNHGTMWHDITVFRAPAGSTVDDFLEVLMADESVFPPTGYEHVGGVGAMSVGVSMWVELDLAPGTYIGACFLPMTSGDQVNTPHAVLGMTTAFEVV